MAVATLAAFQARAVGPPGSTSAASAAACVTKRTTRIQSHVPTTTAPSRGSAPAKGTPSRSLPERTTLPSASSIVPSARRLTIGIAARIAKSSSKLVRPVATVRSHASARKGCRSGGGNGGSVPKGRGAGLSAGDTSGGSDVPSSDSVGIASVADVTWRVPPVRGLFENHTVAAAIPPRDLFRRSERRGGAIPPFCCHIDHPIRAKMLQGDSPWLPRDRFDFGFPQRCFR